MGKPDAEMDRLLAVVGPERGSHSPEDVAAAERALERIAEAEHYATLRGTERNGCLASLVGAVLVSVFLLCPAEYSGDVRLRIMFTSRVPWPYCVGTILARLTWELWLLSGLLLVAGGLGFRQAREWARGVIAAVLTYNIFHYAAALVLMDAASVHHTEWTPETILWAAIWHVSLGALIWGLWRARRYFRSERVRQACGASSDASDEAET